MTQKSRVGRCVPTVPFLRENKTEAVTASYPGKTKLKEKHVEFVIATALGPINNEMLEWIELNNVHLSVSFDGPEDIHSNNRPSKKFNSYENTVDNVRLINKYFTGVYYFCHFKEISTIIKFQIRNFFFQIFVFIF